MLYLAVEKEYVDIVELLLSNCNKGDINIPYILNNYLYEI